MKRHSSRYLALLAGSIVSIAALAGCLSPRQAREAERIALRDERLEEFLDQHAYDLVEVRRPVYDSRSEAVVRILFDSPVPTSAWPLDACDAGTSAMSGVMWLVDLEDDSVSAVTPVWGDYSCFDDNV